MEEETVTIHLDQVITQGSGKTMMNLNSGLKKVDDLMRNGIDGKKVALIIPMEMGSEDLIKRIKKSLCKDS